MHQKLTERWGSRTGFILATIGAAVGLGNVWRFSYVAGENGGEAFLIVYLCSVVLVVGPVVVAQLAIGQQNEVELLGIEGKWPIVKLIQDIRPLKHAAVDQELAALDLEPIARPRDRAGSTTEGQ